MTTENKIGWISALLIIIAYFLISIEYVKSNDLFYNILNLLGGTGLAYRVYLDRNYSNFVLEIIFVLIAIVKIIQIIAL